VKWLNRVGDIVQTVQMQRQSMAYIDNNIVITACYNVKNIGTIYAIPLSKVKRGVADK
jgi:uncharacterized surface protein with fasciclin (FAS1) repeats